MSENFLSGLKLGGGIGDDLALDNLIVMMVIMMIIHILQPNKKNKIIYLNVSLIGQYWMCLSMTCLFVQDSPQKAHISVDVAVS